MAGDGVTARGMSRLARSSTPLLLLAAVLILLLTGWFSAGIADAERVGAARAVRPSQAALSNSLASRVALLDALEQFVRAELPNDPDPAKFETYAAGMRARVGDIRSLQLAPNAVVAFVHPLEGNEEALGHDLAADERPEVRADVERALAGSASIVSGPYELRQDGLGLVVRGAIRNATGRPWGLAILVLDMPKILENAGIGTTVGDYRIALRDAEGRVFFGDAEVFDQNPVIEQVQVGSETWDMGAVPVDGWPGLVSAATAPLWLLGLTVVALLGLYVYSGQRYQSRLAAEVKDRTADLFTLTEELEQNIRERIESAQSLRGSEERFRRLFERSPFPMVMSIEGVVVDSNAAFADLLGFDSPDDVCGMSIPELVAPRERRPLVERMTDRLAGKDVASSYEITGLRADGTEIPVQLDVIVIDSADGPTIMAVATDLRGRIEREGLLKDREALFRSLFQRSPIPLLEEDFSQAKQRLDSLGLAGDELRAHLDADPRAVVEGASGMRVVRANEATLELVGANREEALFGTLDPYAIGTGADIYRDELIAIARGDHRFSGQAKLTFLDGLQHDVLLYWNVAPGFEDSYERVFVSLVDVTELRQTQEELEQYRQGLEDLVAERTSELELTNERLVEAQAAKDKFLAAMSHELRTPLNSIIGFSSVMLQGLAGELSDEQTRQTEMVLASGKHLLGLINQVLDLSRVAAGAIDLQIDEVELSEFTDAVIASANELSRSTEIEFRHSVIGECPIILHTDEMRLRQVVLNLLSNAFKFTQAGHISFDVTCTGPTVVFTVADTGEGISAEDRLHVFEPFYQVRDGKGNRSEGVGLGLPISHEMAELLGGSLVMESDLGQGSSFTFTVPIDPPAPS